MQSLPARVSRSAIWPIKQSATLSAILGVCGRSPATGPRITATGTFDSGDSTASAHDARSSSTKPG
eukprot:8917584-Pyramimonas_sp.AAC.1